MAAFEYVALDPQGKRTKGVLAADSARSARRELRQRQLTLIKLEETGESDAAASGGGRVRANITSSDRVLLTRQLAMLIQAGTPVEEALNAIAGQSPKQSVRRLMLQVRSSVTEGYRLSDALAAQPRAFSPLYRAMAAAGEATGELGHVLARLADLLENQQKVARRIQAAVIYPIILAVVATFVVAALMVFVVPRVVEQFETLNQDLPLLTDIVIAISVGLRSYGVFILVGLVVGVLVFARALAVPPFRKMIDALVLRLPVIGAFSRSVGAARFARTFGSLMQSGVPALDSIEAAKNTVSNRVMRDAVDEVADAVRRGGSVGAAMQKTKAFPALLAFMAASGERSGELGAMLEKGADYLDNETETQTAVALNLLEPFIIIVMGGMVATIVLSIMLPILRLNSLALG